jgi:hypothetical protein
MIILMSRGWGKIHYEEGNTLISLITSLIPAETYYISLVLKLPQG